MKGAPPTAAKCSSQVFKTGRVKPACSLVKILLQACATQTVLLLLALPCVSMPSEELNEAQASRRLRDVAVSIPIGAVSSSANSDSRKGEHCLTVGWFMCTYTRTRTFSYSQLPMALYCKHCVNAADPSVGLSAC